MAPKEKSGKKPEKGKGIFLPAVHCWLAQRISIFHGSKACRHNVYRVFDLSARVMRAVLTMSNV